MREEKRGAAYLTDYRQCGEMTPDREHDLLQAIQIGREARAQLQQHTVMLKDAAALQHDAAAGEQAREELAVAYLPLLAVIARRYSYGSIPMEDLMQEGAARLLTAIESCAKEQRQFPYITVIVKHALYTLIRQRSLIQFPQNIVQATRKVRKVEKCLNRDTGHEPQADDIAEEMMIPPAIVRKLLAYIRASSALSLDIPVSDDPGSITFGELLAADGPTPEELTERWELREQVREVLKTLEPVEESTIRLRFGFVGGEVYSAEETAEELRLPMEQEQRVEIKALRKLRHPSRSCFLRDYL